jgi:hypothetical protein
MPCQGEHVGKPATYGHTIGFLLGTHDHWRNYCGSPSDWIQTSHKKLAAVTNRPWYIFGRTNQPIAWEHAAQTNPYRISIHRRALDSGHIALCHLWATKWLCSRDFLFQNARNDPFLWTCMTGLRWWWLRHSMYPQNLEKKQVFKRPLLFMGGMSCNGVYLRRNTQQTFCSHGSRSSLDALHVALNPDHARTVVWICSGGQGPYGKAFRSIAIVG